VPAVQKTVAGSPAAGSLMVQVAAVSIPQDADILIAALRQHGYTAVVRHEPNDQLLHVQIGPFASRAQAQAMRGRLLADGYNAVIR
jgi:DedD protein